MKFISFLFIFSLSIQGHSESLKINPKEDWPSVSLNERTVKSLVEKKTEVYLVDFWASWCAPCLESLPFYAEELKKMNLSHWTLVAINMDTKKEQALDFLKKIPLATWVLHDDKKQLSQKLKVSALPILYFLNKDGEVLKIEKGFTKESKETFRKNVAEIKKQLGSKN